MPGYSQVTLPDLIAQFYQRMGNNQAFWRQDEVIGILQEAVRVFNVLVGFWRGRVDMGGTLQNRVWYGVPGGMSYLYRIEVNGQPLGSSSLWDLDYGQPGWMDETDVPAVWAPVGANLFALWPASAAGGESLIVEGVQTAPILTSVGFINLGQDEVSMVLDYAEHVAQFKEGGQEFEASQLQLTNFLKKAGERNAVLMQSAKFRNWMGLTDQKKRPMRVPDSRVGAR